MLSRKESPDLVLMTSTGLATKVAVTPATTALVKWRGMPSDIRPLERRESFTASYTTVSPTLMMQFLAMLGPVPRYSPPITPSDLLMVL